MAILKFKSGRDFPSWTFTHFIFSSERNYRKLVIIGSVLDLISAGRSDSDMKVALNSPNAFSDEEISARDFEEFVNYVDKGQDYVEFWNTIRRLDRPAVFVRSMDGRYFEPVYRPMGEKGLRIINAELRSPFNISLEGAAEAFNAMRYSKKREERAEELHTIETQERRTSLRRQQVDLGLAELKLVERRLELLEKVQASPISKHTKQIVAHHVIGLFRNQTKKNTLIEAQITFENPTPEGDAIEVGGERRRRQRLLDEG